MEETQQLIALSTLKQFLSVCEFISQTIQSWLFSTTPFMDLASSLAMIPSVVILTFGLFAAVFGGRFIPFRIIAVVQGLILGWLLGGWCASLVGISPQLMAYASALLLAILGGFQPVSLFSFIFGILGAVFTYEFTDLMARNQEINDSGRFICVLGGFLVVTFLAFIAEKVTIVLSVATVGALASVLGFIGLAKSVGIRSPLLENSLFAQISLGVIFIASAALQFRYATTENQRQNEKILKAQEKAKQQEDREREQRFEKYGSALHKSSARHPRHSKR